MFKVWRGITATGVAMQGDRGDESTLELYKEEKLKTTKITTANSIPDKRIISKIHSLRATSAELPHK